MPRSLKPSRMNYPRSLEEFRRDMNSLIQQYFTPITTSETLGGFLPPLIPWKTNFPMSLNELQHDIDNLIERFFTSESMTEMPEGFIPKMTLAETDKSYEIAADLPGVAPEDINIEIKGNELWITGERKQQIEEDDVTFYRIENQLGSFQRVIPLTSGIKEDQIEAEYTDGVLRIALPKVEEDHIKRIEIKSQ